MSQLILVAIGGCLGAMARYKIGGAIVHMTPGWKFPISTFVVNISGCFAAGILAGLVEKRGLFTPNIQLLLFTGFLGGFTTFSAFGLETVHLIQRQQMAVALANAGASVVFGVLALWVGIRIIP